jgi:hypothetical protein
MINNIQDTVSLNKKQGSANNDHTYSKNMASISFRRYLEGAVCMVAFFGRLYLILRGYYLFGAAIHTSKPMVQFSISSYHSYLTLIVGAVIRQKL